VGLVVRRQQAFIQTFLITHASVVNGAACVHILERSILGHTQRSQGNQYSCPMERQKQMQAMVNDVSGPEFPKDTFRHDVL
jgi:hypothetical protein